METHFRTFIHLMDGVVWGRGYWLLGTSVLPSTVHKLAFSWGSSMNFLQGQRFWTNSRAELKHCWAAGRRLDTTWMGPLSTWQPGKYTLSIHFYHIKIIIQCESKLSSFFREKLSKSLKLLWICRGLNPYLLHDIPKHKTLQKHNPYIGPLHISSKR